LQNIHILCTWTWTWRFSVVSDSLRPHGP